MSNKTSRLLIQTSERYLRMGARKSPLSLAQVDLAQSWLAERGSFDFALWTTETTGDKTPGPLGAVGGKGLFTKELLESLANQEIQCAVHSLKDVEVTSEETFPLVAFLPREDPRDVLVSPQGYTLENLPHNATIGTVSPRRIALLQKYRPDCQIVPLRGNLGTRIEKLETGTMDAIILAAAGLKRLGWLEGHLKDWCHFLEVEKWIPAAGQGIVTVQTHTSQLHHFSGKSLSDPLTEQAARSERFFLRLMGGGCHTPAGAYVYKKTATDPLWHMATLWGDQNLSQLETAMSSGSDPMELAKCLAEQLKALF